MYFVFTKAIPPFKFFLGMLISQNTKVVYIEFFDFLTCMRPLEKDFSRANLKMVLPFQFFLSSLLFRPIGVKIFLGLEQMSDGCRFKVRNFLFDVDRLPFQLLPVSVLKSDSHCR